MPLQTGLKLFPAALMTTVVLAALQAPAHCQTVSRHVYVSATIASGAPVLDLGAPDFEIREAGEKRDISRIALTRRPMRIALLVATSESAAPVVRQIRGALHTFFDAVDPQHEIVLITTGGTLRVRVPPTTNRERLKAATDRLFAGGANVLLSALVESYDRFLRSGDYQPIVAVITVGDPGSETYPNNEQLHQLGRAIRFNGGTVHGAVVRSRQWLQGDDTNSSLYTRSFGVDICATLAKATDGLCVGLLTVAALADSAELLAHRINQDYSSSPPGHEIEYAGVGKGATPRIEVTRPGVRVEILSSR